MLQWKAISTVQSTTSCQYLSSNASIIHEYSKLKEGVVYTQMCYAIIESERKRRKELTDAIIVCNTQSCGG
jgi:hypothetical protein